MRSTSSAMIFKVQMAVVISNIMPVSLTGKKLAL